MSDRSPFALPGGGRLTAAVTAGIILMLAVGSLLFPGGEKRSVGAGLVVLDPGCQAGRRTTVYEPLTEYAGGIIGQPLELTVVRSLAGFDSALARKPVLVLCPDGVAVATVLKDLVPLATGRRSAPRNLRPRSVLVYRRDAVPVDSPWLDAPRRTIIGDSLSLCGTGAWRAHDPRPAPGLPGPAWGADPYDHAGVLHALRLGGFDFAVVRQWDADRFFAAGLLSDKEWGREILSPPAPDALLLCSRRMSASLRLALGEKLARLGRQENDPDPSAIRLATGLGNLNLAGFNLLLDPDFDLVRRNFPGHWPASTP